MCCRRRSVVLHDLRVSMVGPVSAGVEGLAAPSARCPLGGTGLSREEPALQQTLRSGDRKYWSAPLRSDRAGPLLERNRARAALNEPVFPATGRPARRTGRAPARFRPTHASASIPPLSPPAPGSGDPRRSSTGLPRGGGAWFRPVRWPRSSPRDAPVRTSQGFTPPSTTASDTPPFLAEGRCQLVGSAPRSTWEWGPSVPPPSRGQS